MPGRYGILAEYNDPKIHKKILKALKKCSGNKYQAAKLVGISRGQFYRALEVLGWDNKETGTVKGNSDGL